MSIKRRIDRLEEQASEHGADVPFVIIDEETVTVAGIGTMTHQEYEEHHADRIQELRAEARGHEGRIFAVDFNAPKPHQAAGC